MSEELNKKSPLTQEDLQTLKNIILLREKAEKELGQHRTQYIRAETACLQEIEKALEAQDTFFKSEAEKRGFEAGKPFSFDFKTNTFKEIEEPQAPEADTTE